MVGQVSMGVNPSGKYKELLVDASGRLECSVNEIELTAETINLNTDTLESLQTAMSAKLTDIDNSVIASTNVVSKLNLIETTNNANEVLLTACSAKLTDIDTTSAATATILRPYLIEGNVDTANIKSGIDSISACCAGSEVQVDIVGGGFGGAITNAHLTELGTAINSAKVDVNIASGNISGFSTSALQGTANTELTAIKNALQSLDDIVQAEDASHGTAHKGVMSLAVRQDTQADFGGDGDYCPMSIDANGDLRVKIDDASKTHLSEIESAVETIEACVGSNKVNVNISSGNISGFATETTLGNAEAHLGTIDTNIANAEAHLGNIDTGVDVLEACVGSNKVNVNISSGNISGFATETTLGNAEAHLGTIDTNIANAEAHLGNIDTGVDVLEACVGSNKVNVNISSGNISGFATETTLGNAEAHLGTIDTNIANAEAHLGNIDTGVDVLEACVGSNKVNVNISSGNISGFATSTLQGTINTSLGTLETSLTSMEGKQDTQITHLGEIEGAVETLEACVSSNKVATINTQDISEGVWIDNAAVNSTSFSASLETTGYTKLRLYGVVDSDFGGIPPNMIITGSLTSGGTYTPLDNSTDGIDTNSKYISSATVIGVNATIDNPPKFIKLYNLHGSTNFTFTLNYSLCN